MLLTENYFDELDIKDKDIHSDDNNDLTSYTASEQFEYFKNHYTDTILLFISRKLNINHLFSKVETIAKKMNSLFDLYDIEHSKTLLCDPSVSSAYMNKDMDAIKVFERPQFNLYSADDPFLDNIFINPDYNYYSMYIAFYVNYPKFTYRKAYSFVQQLMKIVWSTIHHVTLTNITLLYPVCIPNFRSKGYSNKVAYIYPEHMDYSVNDCVGNELWIDGFFRQIMWYFFGEEPEELI